jgi:hypothetical protein
MKNRKLLWCSMTVIAFATLYFGGIARYPASAGKRLRPENNTPQTLPFTQNWSSAALITADDDWTGVPGIIGYQGTDLFTTIGGDLSTVVADGSGTAVDVFANHADPDTFISGGVTEFDGIANPVVALQGSATADVPHIVIHLNTTGATNINFTCNLRDIDNSADNSAQQINVQYRVGASGDYTNVPSGYFPDVSLGPTTTAVTAVNLSIPAAANNQPLVTIRVATVNATGSDEWIGIDDINILATVAPVNQQHISDYDGDGKTDWGLVRNTGGGPGGQLTWFIQQNLNGSNGPIIYQVFGSQGDEFVPNDYDGDNKTDVAIWRPSETNFYILQSQTSTLRAEQFGISTDDPSVVGDYDGDGKCDLAVYRGGVGAGNPSTWFWRVTAGGPAFARIWGQNGDFAVPGDYNGDGKHDFVVQRNAGGGQAAFWANWSSAAPGVVSRYSIFGTPTDNVRPGDYDGDGKTDYCVTRGIGGALNWFYEPSTALNTFIGGPFGISATDFTAQGDYDGDGTTDFAVWRPDANPANTFFYVRRSGDGSLLANEWGQNGDYPPANYDSH